MTTSASTTKNSFLSLTTAGVIGIGIGMAIGIKLQKQQEQKWSKESKNHLTKKKNTTINNNDNNNNNDDDNIHQKKEGTNNGTHAVRSFNMNNDIDQQQQQQSQGGCIFIPREKLEEFVAQILLKTGKTTPDHAKLVASVLAYADSRGIPSHGVNRADTYVNELMAGVVDGKAIPQIVEQQSPSSDTTNRHDNNNNESSSSSSSSSCTVVINGNNALGAVVAHFAMTTAIERAKQFGIAMVVCHSSNHFGAAGYWAQMAAAASLLNNGGMIGMSFTNTSPFAVPTGGKTRAVGTNPFCFFAPASNGDSFQLDMATTVVPIGKIEVMHRLNKSIPLGWGVDRNGLSCTDGEEICRHGGLYPLGGAEETAGYKGYGLGMFVEILCGVLSGCSTFGPNIQPWLATRKGPIDYGHCFLVIDPNRFDIGNNNNNNVGNNDNDNLSSHKSSSFQDRLAEYLQTMRSLPAAATETTTLPDGTQSKDDGNNTNTNMGVQVAGDPEKGFEQITRTKGVILHAPVAATLKKLAERFHIQDIPIEFQNLDSTSTKESLYAK